MAPGFFPKSSLLHPSCKAGGHASALGLGMVMTSGSKADATKKVPEVPEVPEVPGAKKAAEAVKGKDNGEWRMELPEPVIESEVGADYIPLLTALKLGNYEEADQLTRDLLITIGGEGTKKRGFVYYAEAPKLPLRDMQTLDRLWVAYSKGKFGYSVQKDIWNSKVVKGDFSKFVEQIAWTTGPCGGCDKICSGCPGTLKRWTGIGAGGNEYCYDLDKAKKGHLPLTSALRGTYLLKSILSHKAFGFTEVQGSPLVRAGGGTVTFKRRFEPTGRDAVTEPMQKLKDLRMSESPYTENKKPWDV